KIFDENDDIFDEMYEESVSYKQPENSNSISVSSSNKTSSIPNDQSPKKKVKLNKCRSDDETCVKCQVKTINLRNESILCGCKLQYDSDTGNMSNHLRNIYNLNKTQDKQHQENTDSETSDNSDNEPLDYMYNSDES
ncbi:32017_t:CDS:2, partial [Racocetra persica]